MYCNQCGKENSDEALYCSHDGAALTQAIETFQLNRENVKFCQNCSHENARNGTYCTACGQSFEKVTEKVEERVKVPGKKLSMGTEVIQGNQGLMAILTNKVNSIRSIKYIGITLLLLFVYSFLVSSSTNYVLREAFRGDFGGFVDGIKLVSMTDVFMLSHMTSVNYSASIAFFEGMLETTGGFFPLLVIPAIIFVLIGFFMQRKHKGSSMIDRLAYGLSFSILYGLIVGVISLFSGVSYNMSDPTGFVGEIMLSSEYPFLESIFNAASISFIFTSVGSMIGLSKEQRLSNYQFGVSISRAILNTVVGLTVMGIIGMALITSTDEITVEDGSVIIGSQLGGYLWNITQFGTLELEFETYGEGVTASYSLLGGAKASEDEEGFKELFADFNVILWLLVLIPIGLHFWTGRQLARASQGNLIYELGAYSLAFGVVNAIIVSIFKLTVDTNFDGAVFISFGYSVIATFLISTLMAMAISYVAVMLTNRQVPQDYDQQTYSA